MTKLTPQNINGTIANWKIIKKLDNNTFAEVTTADITALWFSPSSSSSWTVDGLDWVMFDTWGNMQYRANYRWDTIASRWIGGKWCWYDPTTKKILVSNDNSVTVYDLQGNLTNTITTVWAGGILKGNTSQRIIFTRNGSQKINLDTYVITSVIASSVLEDISPDGSVAIYTISTQNFASVSWTKSISSINTSTMASISTYNLTHVAFPSNNAWTWATLINNIDMVIYYAIWGNWSVSWNMSKINIATSTETLNVWGFWSASYNWYSIQYSPFDNKIYYGRDTNTWWTNRPVLYTTTTNLSWQIAVWNSIVNVLTLYRTSDNSIWFTEWVGSFQSSARLILKTIWKNRSTFPQISGNWSQTQIAIIY